MQKFVALLLLAILCAAPAHAKVLESYGSYSLPGEDANCDAVSDHVYRVLPNFEASEDDRLAFQGGAIGSKLCFNALYPNVNDVVNMFDWAYMVSIMGSYPLEELSTPQPAITGPIEDCWPVDVGFDDYNGDNVPDILMLISCYNVSEQQELNNNVVWYSVQEQGDFHWRQDPGLNAAVASKVDYASAKAAVLQALSSTGKGGAQTAQPAPPGGVSGIGGGKTAASPPPPPPSPSPAAGISICTYDTEWGELTITFDENTSVGVGNYAYKNGRIEGKLWEGTLEGVWTQSDGQGQFSFVFGPDGFTGKWKYMGDPNWRGEWNGTLRGCR